MKYLILLGDGMADTPYSELNNQTPLDVAHKPIADQLATMSLCGMVQTVPEGMEPGSGPANMSVMGYAPELYFSGRSSLEAVSMGISLSDEDTVFRCNLVTLDVEDNTPNTGIMNDYSAGEISTEEARELIHTINASSDFSGIRFFPGRSYRHCMIWTNGPMSTKLTPPHDISGRDIVDYLPSGTGAAQIKQWMSDSFQILNNHPVNIKRIKEGKKPANSIWLWGQGKKPALPDFFEIYKKRGAVISAVDLLFGIGSCAGLKTVEVDGATGTIHSNLKGKAEAAVKLFEQGYDYVYLHVEAADECGHQGDHLGKVQAIEKIDTDILKPLVQYLSTQKTQAGEDYKIMYLPDHPTPLEIRTHTSDPVPFMLYDSRSPKISGIQKYCERMCQDTGHFFDSGPKLFQFFIS